MKKIGLLISCICIVFITIFCVSCFAEENKIVLNEPLTDDVNHTFKYPNLAISKDVNPHSLSLSIDNGYFSTSDGDLNTLISTYFDFKGGTDISNNFIGTLNTTTQYKTISLNIKNTVDLDDTTVKNSVITSTESFVRDILFYNETNKDAKFTLTFSEFEMKFIDASHPNGLDVVAFQSPGDTKEHYYMKVENSGIAWDAAYNIAAGMKWNNLQGYLATITTEEEHNFIYNSLGSIEGWIGAAAIENSEDIEYNTQNIVWDPATEKLTSGYRYKSGTSKSDDLIEQYWYWVAGPEAGQRVFDGYNHFKTGGASSNEPNNAGGNEWVAEYGFGEGGAWNDYPVSVAGIKGYYIEFGGFPDDNTTVLPVSLTNTFKWNDYDFRNVEKEIKDIIDEYGFDENTPQEEIEEMIEEAIEKTGLDIKYEILERRIVDNKVYYDVELSIGEDEDRETHMVYLVKPLTVPNTYDNIYTYIFILLISSVSLLTIFKLRNRKDF